LIRPDSPEQGSAAAAARLLRPIDDVATALADLRRGTPVRVSSGPVMREVTLCDDIRIGHKFAVHELASGVRVRKYGEFIGRTTTAVPAGAWVHEHNLATGARHDREDSIDWYDKVEAPNVLRVLGSRRCHVGENALYDEARDALYWIDVRETPAIFRLDLASGKESTWALREDIGSIALVVVEGERLLAGLRSGFAFFDCATGAMTPIVDPEAHLPLNRMNDGKCDPAGRFWCGSMRPDSALAAGSLYVLDRDLQCRRVLDDLAIPNGMAWSADGRTMLMADTRRGYIYAWDFDVASGTLGARRVFADLGAMPGGPDGATLDAEGYLWSAQFDGGCLIRYAPDGAIDRIVRMPVAKPASCAFGGRDYRQLFVTTASRGMSHHELRAMPDAGHVFVLDVGVAGLPPVRFAPEKMGPGSNFREAAR
jgi:sugar lactone lactonase YvrE